MAGESAAGESLDPPPAVRRILHCDMDCFYAAIHVRDDPSLAGKPVLVGGKPGGRGVVAAANYEARRYGVHSAMPSTQASRLCPHAVFLPPDFSRYRAESEKVFTVFRQVSDVVQSVSIDEAYIDVTECFPEWGSATAIARHLREAVLQQTGLTMSVGVGPNKLVAKVASDFRKPDGLTVVPPAGVERFLAPLSVRVLPGVGPATQRSLARLDVSTVADLRRWRETALVERFGKYGRSLFRFARGLDERPVRTGRQRKSLSAERTYAQDLETEEEIREEIGRLASRVAKGLAKKDLRARTVSVKVRYSDFTTVTRAATLPMPTRDAEALRRSALELMARTDAGRRPVRLLGVGTSNLGDHRRGQLVLFAGSDEG